MKIKKIAKRIVKAALQGSRQISLRAVLDATGNPAVIPAIYKRVGKHSMGEPKVWKRIKLLA